MRRQAPQCDLQPHLDRSVVIGYRVRRLFVLPDIYPGQSFHRLDHRLAMDETQLFKALIREYLFASLFRAFAESLASENASRLASMQVAERNIDDRLRSLTSESRQFRQTSITSELLDIIAAYEALRGRQRGST